MHADGDGIEYDEIDRDSRVDQKENERMRDSTSFIDDVRRDGKFE